MILKGGENMKKRKFPNGIHNKKIKNYYGKSKS